MDTKRAPTKKCENRKKNENVNVTMLLWSFFFIEYKRMREKKNNNIGYPALLEFFSDRFRR